MAKKIDGLINLQVPAGAANPSPPIGPALGQRGVNIMEFCKSFNAKTKDLEQGTPIPVKITVFSDRSFTFEMRTAAGVLSSSRRRPEIAHGQGGRARRSRAASSPAGDDGAAERDREGKLKDMNTDDVDAAARTLAGSARSMGLKVVE